MDIANTTLRKTGFGISRRKRRIVFVGGILGLIFNNLLMVLYLSNGDSSQLLWATNITYNIILAGVTFAAHMNFHVMRVAVIGMTLVYIQIWARTFIEASAGVESFINIPVLFFCPIAMALVSNYRLMLVVSVAQPMLLYFHASNYGFLTYAAGWTASELGVYSSAMALVSLMACMLLTAIAYLRDTTDRKVLALLAEKDALAAEDSLTGLKNRRSFIAAVSEALAVRQPLACAFIDLDRFKPLNDEYGHLVGDEILRAIGDRLGLQDSMIEVARFGGDEFAVLVAQGEGERDPLSVMESIHSLITADITTSRGNVGVGASIGFCTYPDDATSQSDLMHYADTAMRRAKAEQAKVARFDRSIDASSLPAAALEMALQDALDTGRIQPALQPIACVKTDKLLGYELLARWVDSNFVRDPMPIDFIPLAERGGLLNAITLSTLDQALAAAPLSDGQFLAINVSPSQLTSSDFLESIEALLAQHGVQTCQIDLEVTEQVAFRNLDRNLEVLRVAKSKGFTISLDDFGVGYSSLAMLNTMPLDKVKIDRSFVQDSNASEPCGEILDATIGLVKKLGITCCVEGIEDPATLAKVKELGCNQMQGYLIGRPMLVNPSPSEVVVTLDSARKGQASKSEKLDRPAKRAS